MRKLTACFLDDQRLTLFHFVELPYNQKELCASATWNPDAIRAVNDSTVIVRPSGLFIDGNNMIYVNNGSAIHILVWLQGNFSVTRTISTPSTLGTAVFVATSGDIYSFSNESNSHGVVKWTNSIANSSIVMQVDGNCFAVFVDVYDNIYCSMNDQHQVVKRSFFDAVNMTGIIAGNGTNGSTSYLLSSPRGIFVTAEFDLYVADCDNDRVQKFSDGAMNATTVIGNGTVALNCPSSIAVGSKGDLFISDTLNHRIVAVGLNGVRCIVGCTAVNGSAANELNLPASLAFDTLGNLFVADEYNDRIQFFELENNICGKLLDDAKRIGQFCEEMMSNETSMLLLIVA